MTDPLASFDRTQGAGGTVWVLPSDADDLASLNCATFDDWMAYEAGSLVDRNRARHVVRLRLDTTYFLKRFVSPPWKDFIGPMLRGRGTVTHARREAEAAVALSRAGVRSYEVVALGEAAEGFARRSFLVTRDLGDHLSLDKVVAALADLDDAERRVRVRELVHDIARLVRTMHGASISHPDLYSNHLFVSAAGRGREMRVIDLHRVTVGKTVSLFHAARDITGLHLTCVSPFLSRSDRVRFLLQYLDRRRVDAAVRRLVSRVLGRARRIAGRGRFRAFQAEGS